MNAVEPAAPACTLCGGRRLALVAEIKQRPARETDFGIPPAAYCRQVLQCQDCGVFNNQHAMLAAALYCQQYNKATYQNDLSAKYAAIRALPLPQSDNKQRVQRVIAFSRRQGQTPARAKVLDVGSGLCVFLAEMQAAGYAGYCIDPDPQAVAHARQTVQVAGAYAGAIEDYQPECRFDIITLNKVLEHVRTPITLLQHAKRLLAPGGFLYVELPDGEAALQHGGAHDREEFYIEHVTVFSPRAVRFLINAAGFAAAELASIHEPSDKFTTYAFLTTGAGQA